MIENVTGPTEFLRPFPEPEEVFVPEQCEVLRRHLHPLFSVDLAAANPAWSGWVHMLSPIEPCEGYVGDYTRPYHGAYLKENWIGFEIVDGKYRLQGDPRFFLLESPVGTAGQNDAMLRSELAKHYEAEEKSFRQHHDCFRRHGVLVRLNDDGAPMHGEPTPDPLAAQIGGVAGDGNWVSSQRVFPIDVQDDGEAAWPLDAQGRRYEFVAGVPGWHYRSEGADWILLFYQPETGKVLFTFDWS